MRCKAEVGLSIWSSTVVPFLVVCLSVLALGAIAQQGQLSPADASPDHDGRGAIAILRRDGLLFPFASFDRDSWRVTWPVHLAPQIEIPLTRADIPMKWWGTRWPDQWRAHLTSGDEMFLKLEDPTVFTGVLRTDARSPNGVPLKAANPADAREPVSQGRAGDQRRGSTRTD